jgi:MFS family permease
LAGITRNFAQLFIVRSVLGIGEGGSTPASLSLLGDYFPQAQRARILSYWSAGTVFGVAIGFAVGALVADAFGWRWAFYSVGIPGLIAAFLAWRMTEPERGAFDKEESEAQPVETAGGHGALGKDLWSSAKNLFKIPTYLALIGALVFSYFVFGGIAFWLPSYLVTSFNLHVSQAGAISGGVVVGGGLVGVVTGGWLADFLHRRRPEGRLFVATLGFLLGAPLFLLALFIHTLLPFLAVLILAAIALDFCIGPLNAVIQDVILPEVRATALGLALLLAHLLGDAAAPSIIGLIANTHTLGFALIITTPTSLFLAGLICLLGLRTVAQDMYRMQQQIRASEVAINKGKSEIS